MARALCWTALWDSARDAVTPAARYVDAVERFGPAEPGIGVLLNVLGNAVDGGRTLRAPGPARRRAPRLPDHGRRTAAGGGAGLRPAAGLGPDPCRDQPLRRRPAGPAPGHPGRQHGDRGSRGGRRTALESLACAWRPTARPRRSSSTQELARDNTAAGKSGHATALAARPEAAVKAAAWDAAVHGTALSNQLLSATIAGFNTGAASPAGRVHRPVLRVPRAGLGGPEHRDRQPDRPRPLPRGTGPRRPGGTPGDPRR